MLCCKKKHLWGWGRELVLISFLGMEVGELMEGKGTAYGFTLGFYFHIALCCVL